MNKIALSAGLLVSLLLSANACANPQDDALLLPAVQVRPHVAWVGSEHNERIVTLATVNVRPDAITHLQSRALDVLDLLPQFEAVKLPALGMELPNLSNRPHSVQSRIGGL